MKKSLLYLTIAVVLGLLAVVIVKRFESSDAGTEGKKLAIPPVRVAAALRENLESILVFSGDINPALQANIFSRVGGNLDHNFVDLGSKVHANQLLALIDTTALFEQEEQVEASYSNAKSTYQRTKSLVAQNLASQQDLDNATSALNLAKANYDLTRTQLDYAKIRAPFSGFITKRFLDPGSVVSASTATTLSNTTLFTLMDIDSVKVLINVLDEQVEQLAQVKRALVRVDALPDKTFDGKLSRIGQAVSTTTRTMTVEVTIPNKDYTIKPGMFARVSLLLGEHANALTIPSESVLRDKDGTYVFTVQGKIAHRVPVKTGMEQSNRTEILSGLDGSEQVIVTGQNFVKDNGKVSLQQ